MGLLGPQGAAEQGAKAFASRAASAFRIRERLFEHFDDVDGRKPRSAGDLPPGDSFEA